MFSRPRNYPEDMIIPKDDAPSHEAFTVGQYLVQKLTNRGIPRVSPILSPQGSAD